MKKIERTPTKEKLYRRINDSATVLIGVFAYSLAINLFFVPGGVVTGGITGIATVLNFLFSLPVGIMIFVLNAPLILITMKFYGVRFCLRTLFALGLITVVTDLVKFIPATVTDPLLCAVGGGALMGIGIGLLFTRGYTTGGSDLLVWLLKLKFRHLSTGRLILSVDLVIIVASAIILRSYVGVFYSLTSIIISTRIVDMVMGGADRATLYFIFSEKYPQIADALTGQLRRGVTVLSGIGWYTKEERHAVVCVVLPSEMYRLREYVKAADPNAFIVGTNATEVLGRGFKEQDTKKDTGT